MARKNILLIDDDTDDQEIFLIALQKTKTAVQCTTFDSAATAMDKLSARQVSPDLIFLDLNLPVMNGQQFLQAIKKDEGLKDIPVIILSTSAHKATIELTKELGARQFLSKPGKFEDLVCALDTVLNHPEAGYYA